jgi:hypothetical protein
MKFMADSYSTISGYSSLFFSSFFFVWVIAIDTANYSLQLVHTDCYKAENFKKIADLKQGYISGTMKIVVWGLLGSVSLFVYLTSFYSIRYSPLSFLWGSFFFTIWMVSVMIVINNWPRTPRRIRQVIPTIFK